MEEYKINFQDVLDQMSLMELKKFKEALYVEYDLRVGKELEEINKRKQALDELGA
tara:strand:- start:578 stop:742 length:165 start_codon:yes stop_codon:yes gene_type:complete